jgi:biotin synthase
MDACSTSDSSGSRFDAIADGVLAGTSLSRDDARAVLRCHTEQVPDLLRATFRVRHRHHGRRVKFCLLRNARSGLCPEDCHYCSQSAVSEAAIPRYRLDSVATLVLHARRAVTAGARRYCMVTSGRGPSEVDVDRFTLAARAIKAEFPELELCVSLGIMDDEQALALKEAGIGWVNHNLNTSERFHPEICSTHTYADRMRTVRSVQRAGLSSCSGGIIGMGENDEDVIDLAFALRDLAVDSLPVNFLHPIEGTPLENTRQLDPGRCLAALCLFRLTNPATDLRVAGGRELNLGWFQSLALLVANSIFVDGYLTTPGQHAGEAHEMVASMGLEVEAAPEPRLAV